MSITMAMKPKSPRSNIIVTMRTAREGHAAPRRFRDAADSHRDHLRSETHVAGERAGASGHPLFVCAVCQTEGGAMKWNEMGAMHEHHS